MINSIIYRFFKKRNEKNKARKIELINKNRKKIVLFLNSNPWFSAVTDYSLQLCLYLKDNNEEVIYGAEKGSTIMDKKCKENGLPFFYVPIHNLGLINFIVSFIKIFYILVSTKYKIEKVFCFEGREHTILILIKILFPFIWEKKKLIRVRGQSQVIKKNFLSIAVYKYYTDKIIFAADCVLNRVSFNIPEKKYIVQRYCKSLVFENRIISSYKFSENFPCLNLDCLTFLIVGRFDPVKGHDIALQSFLSSGLKNDVQLVFIGKSENIEASSLLKKYQNEYDSFIEEQNEYYLQRNNKRIFIIDRKIDDIYQIMENVHFGLITSLASEVICRVGVEFLQCGIPCLYTKAGALQEVFNDFPNFQVETGDVESLKLKMEECEIIFNERIKYDQIKINCKKVWKEKYSLENFKRIFDFI